LEFLMKMYSYLKNFNLKESLYLSVLSVGVISIGGFTYVYTQFRLT